MHTVAVLAVPDVIGFDLATPVETFRFVRLPDGRPGYRVIVAGDDPWVEAGPMRIAPGAGLEALERADIVIVPGRNDFSTPLPESQQRALQAAADRGATVASICVGAFSLAEAGLLDGRRATTHWLAADELARRYPTVVVDPDALYIDEGPILTSAGASAGLDLCLHLVQRDYGVAVAADAARLAVAPLQRSGGQAQFMLRNRPTDRTATLERVLEWIDAHTHQALTLEAISEFAGLSPRTLTRRFHAETGQSPMQWVGGARVRQAQELLETTDRTVDGISAQVGFPSPSSFRVQFARTVGVTPGAYRSTFRPAA